MIKSTAPLHRWGFFRAGGFDQVRLDSGSDLMNLDQLDQKLWVALACPIAGLEFDPKTAAMIDTDHDGRIRAPELIAAVQWAGGALKNPDTLLQGGDSLSLDAINDLTGHGKQILASARRLLAHLGQTAGAPVTLAQAMDANSVFASALFNGDGVIVPECADDPALAEVVREIMECMGPVTDRSGKPGADQERTDKFFEACAAFDTWMKQAEADPRSILPAGAGTAAAAAAVSAIKPKVDDYFGRCRVAAFDPRALDILNRTKEEYIQIAAHDLTIDAKELAAFPLAPIAPGKALPLKTGLNPAHAAAVATLLAAAVQPLWGDCPELTEAGWAALQAKLGAYQTWKAAKAGAAVEKLGLARVRALLAGMARAGVNALIAKDKALEAEAANVANVEKLLRYVRDLGLLCRNFVNFSDLYAGGGPAIFQCGTLYLDQRACFLCLTVEDAGRHAAMAGLSGAYLAYCDCARKGTGEKLGIVAVVSQGDDENLMVGRNGVFYDRKGRDYDATITKIVASPISLRQAFWAPYKKLVRTIEEYIAKRAATADADIQTDLTAAATAAPAAGAPTKPLFDPSVIALLSLAIGSLAAGAATVLAFLGKVPLALLPLVLAGVGLVVSSPSLLLAFIKLRKRNLGPILDANGWAINAKAKINVPFGERLTALAKLPGGASLDTNDRYAEKRVLWPKLVAAALALIWVYSLLSYSGVLYVMTKDWKYPLGEQPSNYKPVTNAPPPTVPPPSTNAPAK
ncbi:MAG: hypothetical protein ABSG04_06540 [Verrucomicrobiota bacterium]|jgi:hypothetical protein